MNTNKTSKKSSSTFDRAIRWPSALGLLAFLATIVVSSFSDPAAAAEPRRAAKKEITSVTRAKFDHIKTGFPLIGAHVQAKCETCHQNGVFKGTARQCDVCHAPGNRMAATFKGQKHVSTTESCDRCHTAVVWAPVRFNHSQVAPGSCATCHNTVMASGKPNDHIQTRESCDKCHNTSIWTGAGFAHDASTVGNCTNCHGGAGPGIGQGAGHIRLTGTAKQCDACHRSVSTFSSRVMDHGGLDGQCSTCHNGAFTSQNAQTFSSSHPVGTTNLAECDSCHKSFSTWLTGAKPDHSKLTTACSNCHGKTASGPTSTKPLHNQFSAVDCISCHTTASWLPASKWNHSQITVAQKCDTCHTGGFPPADGKIGNHIVNSNGSCDACHKAGYSTWAGGKFHSNVSVTNGCETCHNVAGTVGPVNIKVPTTAVHSGVSSNCQSCHTSASTPWTSAVFKHAAANALGSGTCDTCHNGKDATGKVTGHIGNPTGAKCDACHNSQSTWSGGKFHSKVTVSNGCETCHNVAGTVGPVNIKVPTTAVHSGVSSNCQSCHTSASTPWTSAVFKHAAANALGSGTCDTCHNGKDATGKVTGHIGNPTGAKCDACHNSQSTWSGGKFHSKVTVSNGCETCHNVAGTVGPVNIKVPTTAVHSGVSSNCQSCHTSASTPWTSAVFKHAAANALGSGTCDTCHNGKDATGKVTGHIGNPTGAKCDACHNSQSTWSGGKFHSKVTVSNGCETCHNVAGTVGPVNIKVPTTAVHSGVSSNCQSCHTSASTPWASAVFKHTAANAVGTGTCDTCHIADKVTQHIPTGASKCDACHKSQTVWSGTRYHSNVSVSTGCAACHTVPGMLGPVTTSKPNTTVHNGVTACEGCHTSPSTPWASVVFKHTAANAVGTGTCDTCHIAAKAANHIPTGASKCDACHKSQTVWSGTRYHSNVSVSTGCAACHTVPGMLGPVTTSKPNTAIHTGVTVCETCHTSPSIPWSSAVFKHDATTTNNCLKCHTGTGGGMVMNQATHIPGTLAIQCDQCHKSTNVGGFATKTMNHTVVAATPCSTCHSATYTSQGADMKSTKHIPYEANLLAGSSMTCNICHTSTTVWTTLTSKTTLHNGSQGNGAGWCKGCHLSGQSWSASTEKKSLTHQKSGSTDCSQSGCHKPLGKEGTVYSSW